MKKSLDLIPCNSRNGVKTLIANNPKTVIWSRIGTLVLTAISVGGSYWLYRRKKSNDTECFILATAQTACKIMKQANTSALRSFTSGATAVAPAQPNQEKVSNNDVATTYRNGHTTSNVIVTCIVIDVIVAVVDIAIFKPELIEKGVRKMKYLLKSNKE